MPDRSLDDRSIDEVRDQVAGLLLENMHNGKEFRHVLIGSIAGVAQFHVDAAVATGCHHQLASIKSGMVEIFENMFDQAVKRRTDG